jgi:hypothetical protein
VHSARYSLAIADRFCAGVRKLAVARVPWLSSGCALARQSELTAPQRPNGPHGAGSSPFPCSPCYSLLNVCSLLPRGLRALLVSFCAFVPFRPGLQRLFQAPTLRIHIQPPPARHPLMLRIAHHSCPSCCKSHVIRVSASPTLSALHLCLASHEYTDTSSRPVLVGPSPAST